MTKKANDTDAVATEKKERKRVAIADLAVLEGDAKKQFDALLKSKAAFDKAMENSGDVPLRHLRVLRNNWNREFIANLRSRKAETVVARKERLAERIKKLEAKLSALEE